LIKAVANKIASLSYGFNSNTGFLYFPTRLFGRVPKTLLKNNLPSFNKVFILFEEYLLSSVFNISSFSFMGLNFPSSLI